MSSNKGKYRKGKRKSTKSWRDYRQKHPCGSHRNTEQPLKRESKRRVRRTLKNQGAIYDGHFSSKEIKKLYDMNWGAC